ncbi:DUF2935 domain-containing protein [Aneurinibacillus thermoaerophilus]|jgi:hypothetical protein|uniref:DUF2935 domain-containing protein n=1 Tax=Aneurinibacillus thermoaerophilus TaxID=143495 RepID=A0ABX8Y6X9_ANETH|nr:DUF2935 domain-containing protein [Aneurinibacillus thermoaerophilus]MED0676593.1 DUF2935 domain-containing protein [Aneurinibacillus thermoaerophilus]MED0680396.1 DUF2935 domain-containing protein [Aneurinibacillus thermoaerophilus]MED0735908.1 DUF2935 domain-containing protein [Aneurinibacillus thermoaerophilus]MED0762785.1 DUF2935 domain-containing protein [Aneurinibacillus thermoaerophilus]QYY41227.1 DUF2935 domain-containing protein [Aneurinibacillus thermoaerophilus]
MSNLFAERSLHEIRFWSQIMKEHAFFLRLGFTSDQSRLIQEANQFYHMFENIEERAGAFAADTDHEAIARFNMEVYQATTRLWTYKRNVLGLILSCKIHAHLFPSFIDHISREAAYFMNRLEQLNRGMLDPLPDTVINENVFFLRLMADHAKFIAHMLDPSERNLISEATDLSYQFEQLLFQMVDLESMRPASQTAGILTRLLEEHREAMQNIHAFKQTIRELLDLCCLRGIIHPLFADHTYREANHFLELLGHLEASLTAGPEPSAK